MPLFPPFPPQKGRADPLEEEEEEEEEEDAAAVLVVEDEAVGRRKEKVFFFPLAEGVLAFNWAAITA